MDNAISLYKYPFVFRQQLFHTQHTQYNRYNIVFCKGLQQKSRLSVESTISRLLESGIRSTEEQAVVTALVIATNSALTTAAARKK